MEDCPVCGYEYNRNTETIKFCPKCGWHLFLDPLPHDVDCMEPAPVAAQILNWAKTTWKKLELLEKNPLLEPTNYSLLAKKVEEIQNNTSNLPEILSILREINEKIQENYSLSDQTQIVSNTLGDYKQDKQVSNYSLSDQTQIVSNTPGDYKQDEQVSNYEIDDPEINSLVENYNNHGELPDKIDVCETEESRSRRCSGGKDPTVFEANYRGRGDYWIIADQYLVPKHKYKINQHSYKTISVLFDCRNYDGNAHASLDDMILVKPAKVIPIPNQQKWQLQDTGILEFKTQT
ncbi:MAG: zinc ribbon domain-containing protein [Dolichospermum sp.]